MQGEIGKLSAIRDEHYKLVAVHKQDQVRLQVRATQTITFVRFVIDTYTWRQKVYLCFS